MPQKSLIFCQNFPKEAEKCVVEKFFVRQNVVLAFRLVANLCNFPVSCYRANTIIYYDFFYSFFSALALHFVKNMFC